ncbi:MAG: hypothetical protein ABEJ23_05890 [Haloarculaceae archaeon]
MVLELLGLLALGIAFLGGCLALLAAGRRAYLLARYVTTRPRTADAVDPGPGRRWLRVTGEAVAGDALAGPEGGDALAYRVTAHRQERFAGVPWPRSTTSLLDATARVPFALRGPSRSLRVLETGDVDVIGRNWNEKGATYTPADPPPDALGSVLATHGVDAASKLGDGYAFDHDLRVRSDVVAAGDRVRLFGRFDVRRDDRLALHPASGRLGDVCLTTGPWRTLWIRYLHEFLRALLGGALLVAVAGYFLWPAATDAVAWLAPP